MNIGPRQRIMLRLLNREGARTFNDAADIRSMRRLERKGLVAHFRPDEYRLTKAGRDWVLNNTP